MNDDGLEVGCWYETREKALGWSAKDAKYVTLPEGAIFLVLAYENIWQGTYPVEEVEMLWDGHKYALEFWLSTADYFRLVC